MCPDQPESASRHPHRQSSFRDGERLQLLLIEDDPDDAFAIREYIASNGDVRVELAHVQQLSTGLAHLKDGRFDVALVDLNLPDSLGVDTVVQVHACNPGIPIVVLTGADDKQTALEAVRAGAEDYLCKRDLEPKLLVRTIRYAVERAWRRHAQEECRDKEKRYRALFEESPDGVVLIDPSTGRAVEFNHAACQCLGYSRDEFTRLSISDYEARETPDEIRRHIEKVLREGRDDFETAHRTKAGGIKNILATVKPLVLSGEPLLHCIFRDITDRKRAKELLRKSQERYRHILEAITSYTYSVTFADGFWSTKHTRGCLAVTGYSPEDYAADPYLWIRMVDPEDRRRVTEHIADIRAGKKLPPIEHRILHKNGRTCWIRNTILPRHDAAGRLAGWEGVVEDITERKQAEEVTRQREAHLWAAQAIQARLWPKAPPSLPGFDIAGASCAAEFAAGDFFDYLTMSDGSIGLVVGDVAGHGLGPALIMALTYAHLRSLVSAHTDIRDILGSVNRFLIKETDHFVSLLFGRILPGTRSFVAVNAGHPPGYVVDRSGNVKAQLDSTTFPLAVTPDAEFPYCKPVALESGDVIVLTTDGIREARLPEGPAFGDGGLLDVVRANRERSAAEIVDAVQRAVQEFCRPGRPCDDMTAIVVKVGPEVQSLDSG